MRTGDITKEKTGAIVNPANSYGSMGGGVAWAIKKSGGEEIEREAVEKGPTRVGDAIATSAGRLLARFVIHAPTMENPAERTNEEKIEKATSAALECSRKLGIKSLAFPGMGTGVGGVSKEKAACVMIDTIKRFLDTENSDLERIILVGFDYELTKKFKESLKNVKT